jgi:gluconokinase
LVIVLMGVAGAGKTTVGKCLASELGWDFEDADNYHSAANVDKMRNGIPLTDADRAPWLQALRALICDSVSERKNVVLALKRSHSAASQDEKWRGQARVYSKALVEANKNIMSKAG